MVENRYVGNEIWVSTKRRERSCYGAPRAASRSPWTGRWAQDALILRYAEMIYYGYWLRRARGSAKTIDAAQANVSGRVRLKLYKGNVIVAGRRSDSSLYDPKVATFEEDDVYNQGDADGFIRLNALRLRLRSLSRRRRNSYRV
jgi:argininosuccinate synthase